MYNFRLHLIRTTSLGYLMADKKTFNGEMGILQRHEADIGTGPLFFFPMRMEIIDSSLPICRYRQFFVFRHPKQLDTENVFMKPLEAEVWWCIFGVGAITISILCFLSTTNQPLLTVIASLSQQGANFTASGSSKLKGVLFISFIAGFIYFQFYSATILSSLLSSPPKTINNLDKLLKSNIKIMLYNTPASRKVFLLVNNQEAIDTIKVKTTEASYIALDEGIKLIRSGGYAFFFYVDYGYLTIQKTFPTKVIDELQEIHVLPQTPISDLVLPIQKYSPFKEAFRVGVQTLRETGLNSYWTQYWFSKLPVGSLDDFDTVAVDVVRISTVFYMLGAGHIISFGVFLTESIIDYAKKLYRDKKIRSFVPQKM